MALGTLTVTGSPSKENIFINEATLVGPASYATGGETGLQTALQALTKDGRAIIDVKFIGGSGFVAQWDKANLKLMVFYADNNNASDGALIEVANTTDLSAQTFKTLIFSN